MMNKPSIVLGTWSWGTGVAGGVRSLEIILKKRNCVRSLMKQ